MASVFLSYDRDDAGRARHFAQALEKAGHRVWWDLHVRGGTQFSKAIEEALKAAEVVVVLWSKESVESAWVRDEAAAGRDTGRLVPVTIDGTEPPLGFRQYQTIDLRGWTGRKSSKPFDELLHAIASFELQPQDLPAPGPQGSKPNPSRFAIAAVGIILVLGALALLVWRPWWTVSSTPVVAIAPAAQSSSARAFAEDLFVRLGAAQAGRTGAVELVRGDGAARADLILEVAGNTASASLVLLRAEDRQLLFSQDFETSADRQAALRNTTDVAANAALGCASEALEARPAPRLDPLKTFLGACSGFSSLYGSEEAYIPISQLEQVIKQEPQFIPALRRLLLAGAFMRSIPTENVKPSEQWLRALIEKSRQVDARMPEIGLAEVELLPNMDFAGRFRRLDALAAAHRDNMFVLGANAEQFMRVGRNTEAVEIAERAVRLYPLAPYARSEYVRTLALSGRLDRALEELRSMELMDEVAMNLTETKFRVHLAYGDPETALALFRKYGTNKRNQAILLARIAPTEANKRQAMDLSRSDAARRGFYAPLSEVLVAFGNEDEAYDILMRLPKERADQFLLQTLFRPTLDKLRQSPRFLRIAQHFGLVDYWRASGNWPDFCADPGLPYDCKAEAAKLN